MSRDRSGEEDPYPHGVHARAKQLGHLGQTNAP
jgi:hypothetical protein